jgi:hypothetical protein
LQILYANEHREDTGSVSRLVEAHPLAEQFAYLTGTNLRLSIVVLFGAVIFILLIACFSGSELASAAGVCRQGAP